MVIIWTGWGVLPFVIWFGLGAPAVTLFPHNEAVSAFVQYVAAVANYLVGIRLNPLRLSRSRIDASGEAVAEYRRANPHTFAAIPIRHYSWFMLLHGIVCTQPMLMRVSGVVVFVALVRWAGAHTATPRG